MCCNIYALCWKVLENVQIIIDFVLFRCGGNLGGDLGGNLGGKIDFFVQCMEFCFESPKITVTGIAPKPPKY